MNTQAFVLVALLAAMPMAVVLIAVLPSRLRAERRARELLAQHPAAERTCIYVAFASAWSNAKRQQIDDQIKDMRRRGWTFLRASEANPLRTFCSWGGGVNLHFIRVHDQKTERAA